MSLLPWSDHRAKLDGAEFERVVAEILTEMGRGLPGFRVERQDLITAADGQYRIDVTVRFTQLGADFLVLVECKNHVRPVEREDVQVLADRLRAVGAQKGILFSANGFQRGAIQYARSHGIALVRIIEGALTYETKSLPQGSVRPAPPAWANIPPFVGQLVSESDDETVTVSLIERGRTEALTSFLTSP
jgi:restriction system protein